MRVRLIGVTTALLGVILLAATAYADDGDKKDDPKKKAGNKVELKDLPAAVVQAAEKKAPKAEWTSADTHMDKKHGTVYMLHGKISNQAAEMTITATGDVLRFQEGAGARSKKRPK